jgi:hypothetical protein
VGIAHGFADLADQVEAVTRAEALAPLREVVIQALRARQVVEDQGRAALVLGIAPGSQDAGMVDAVEDGVLALGGLDDGWCSSGNRAC